MTAATLAPTLNIAEAAERTGVTAHTLRYYERVGLLEPVGRDAAGYRAYTEVDVGRVVFLTRMRAAGMPIRELRRYVALVEQGPQTEPERLAIMEAHRDAVRARITELHAALETIEFKIAAYGGACRPPAEAPR